MKKYLSFLRIRFIAGLQYRAAAWAGMATQFFWGGMTILMYRAFYKSDPASFPMSMSALSSYIWLQQAFLALFMGWYYDGEILDSVTTGSVGYELCRPCDLYAMWFIKNCAVRLSRAALRCLPILVFAALLPKPYCISLPASLPAASLFLLSMAMGLAVVTAFSMLVYISAFYTLTTSGVRILAAAVTEFFSGAIIPIPFFPEPLQRVFCALPFASMQSTPFLIWTGHISGTEALGALAMQLIWLTALLAAGGLFMRSALKRVVVQGG